LANFRSRHGCCAALLFVFVLLLLIGCSSKSSSPIVQTDDPIIQPDDPIVEPTWFEPQDIGAVGAPATDRPTIVVTPSGYVAAVWVQEGLWARHFFDPFETHQQISTPGAQRAQVTASASDNLIAVWEQVVGSDSFIWARRYTATSGTWQPANAISPMNHNSYNPQVAMGANENAIVVFEMRPTESTQSVIFASRFNAQIQSWDRFETISAAGGNAAAPQIAIDSNNNALVVWHQIDGSANYDVWANYFNAATDEWSGPVRIENNALEHGYYPSVKFDHEGNALAVWHQYDGTTSNIWAARFDGTSLQWQNPELIETDNAGNANYAQVAFDTHGNAHALWQHSDGASLRIATAFYDVQSARWQTPQLIDQGRGNRFSPKIAMLDDNAVAIWHRFDEDTLVNEIWSAYYNGRTGRWNSASLIDESGDHPSISANTDALAAAIWIDSAAADGPSSVRVSFFE
jgi:hypothetical protein